jgi:hypothetical protein
MRTNWKHYILALAIAVGMGGGAIRAIAAPYDDQAPDYSKNKTYQQGTRDGKDDKAHNKDHSKKKQFKKDEDQKAYEAGYQKGRGN